MISIHAPRVGRDMIRFLLSRSVLDISIHAPRVGRDYHLTKNITGCIIFQSTRPVWGATEEVTPT